MTLAEVRVPRARLLVAVAALVACAAILWLSRGFTFYFDEWEFILNAPDWSFTSYLQPHNEHPAMLPRAIYAVLLSTIGLRSYVPYMLVLLALHAASALLLFELVRRRAGDLVGVACALLLLVIGAGWEDLLWAFQMSFVGSVACGLGALVVLEDPPSRRSLALATGLLTASLMFSAIGLFFGLAAAVKLAATPSRRRQLLWLVPLGVAFVAWYLAFGRHGSLPNPPSSASNILVLPAYVLWGLGSSLLALAGVGGELALVFPFLAIGVLILTWRKRRPDPLAIGVAAGLVAFYLVTGASRAQLGYQQSGAGRYAYIGAVFWLILLADAARFLPWRGTWRPALLACLFLACFSSAALLFSFAVAKTVQMEQEVADLKALAAERSDPCLNPNGAVDLLVMPQVVKPALYYRAIDLYGDPTLGMPLRDNATFTVALGNLITCNRH
jgi:hypothetical protein